MVKEAFAVLECRLWERHGIGSHELIIGEVEYASASEFFGDYWDFAKYNPPLYAGTVGGEQKEQKVVGLHVNPQRNRADSFEVSEMNSHFLEDELHESSGLQLSIPSGVGFFGHWGARHYWNDACSIKRK